MRSFTLSLEFWFSIYIYCVSSRRANIFSSSLRQSVHSVFFDVANNPLFNLFSYLPTRMFANLSLNLEFRVSFSIFDVQTLLGISVKCPRIFFDTINDHILQFIPSCLPIFHSIFNLDFLFIPSAYLDLSDLRFIFIYSFVPMNDLDSLFMSINMLLSVCFLLKNLKSSTLYLSALQLIYSPIL